MAIDLHTQTYLDPARVAALCPEVGGRRPHRTTARNWMLRGCRGVRLESIRVGGRLATTEAALRRFLDQLARLDAPPIEADSHIHPAA